MLISNMYLILICLAAAWFGSLPFFDWIGLRVIFSIPGGLLLAWATRKLLVSKRQYFFKVQFKWLLEHLLTSLSSGLTLESAFLDAPSSLRKILGRNSILLTGLLLLERQLAAHQPLTQCLPQLSKFIPCPDAHRFLMILPELRQVGGQVSQFIRQQLGVTLEHLSLQQEISAETTQRQTEAALLTIMPFILAFLLKDVSLSTKDANGSLSSPIGIAGMILAYAMALSSCVITLIHLDLRITFSKQSTILSQADKENNIPKLFRAIGSLLFNFYQNWLPDSYSSRLFQLIHDDKNQDGFLTLTGCQNFFYRKAQLMILFLLPTTLMIWTCPGIWYFFWILPLAISMFQDQDVFKKDRQRQQGYQLDYPMFINLMSSLLQSGLSVHMALEISLRTFIGTQMKNQINISAYFRQDLHQMKKHLQVGIPASQLLDKLAMSCPVTEARAALLLLSKFDRTGGQEVLLMLQIQSTSCHSLYRNTIRKQLEHRSLRLLLPMTLDLLTVMIIAILPAIQSLQTI